MTSDQPLAPTLLVCIGFQDQDKFRGGGDHSRHPPPLDPPLEEGTRGSGLVGCVLKRHGGRRTALAVVYGNFLTTIFVRPK